MIRFRLFLFTILLSALAEAGVYENPFIIIKSEFGDITVEIYSDRAPVTAANFMKYVDAELYKGACFYRIVRKDNQPNDAVKIEVVQGGRWDDEEKGFSPVPHETTSATGILHKDGVISMARLAPGSATSEFFICIGDQPELDFGGRRNKDGQGFAAFGRVVEGMDIVKKIHSTEAPSQYPDKKIVIYNIVRK